MTVETRTFPEIWNSFSRVEKDLFYEKVRGVRESTIRSYGSGRRKARGPSLICLVDAFKKMGINVADGQWLFKYEN